MRQAKMSRRRKQLDAMQRIIIALPISKTNPKDKKGAEDRPFVRNTAIKLIVSTGNIASRGNLPQRKMVESAR